MSSPLILSSKSSFSKGVSCHQQFEGANDFACGRTVFCKVILMGNGGKTPVRTPVATTPGKFVFFSIARLFVNPMKFGSYPSFWFLLLVAFWPC